MQSRPEENAIYYITTVVNGRCPVFATPSYIIPLYDSLNYYRYKQEFRLLGYVIMPDHLHLLIWPQGTATISDIMRDFKKFTARRIIRQAEVEQNETWLQRFYQAGKRGQTRTNKVWQDSFWDKAIYSEKFLQQKLNYIHNNPIRAGIVDDIERYPYSSYRAYVYNDEALITIDKEW